MKFNKIFLVSIFLLAVFTLGAVSAGDDAGNLTVSDDVGDIIDAPADEIDVSVVDEEPLEKQDPSMTVDWPEEIYYGEGMLVSYNLPEDAAGKVTFYVNDEADDEGYASDYISFSYVPREFKDYKFAIDYTGDDNYNSAHDEFSYTLKNTDYRITVGTDNEVLNYGSEYVDVYCPYGLENPENIVVTVDGKKYNVSVGDGWDQVSLKTSVLKYGENNINVYYPGDDKFGKFSKDYVCNVKSCIDVKSDYVYGEDNNIVLKLPGDATGKLTVFKMDMNDETYEWEYEKLGSADMKNGIAKFSLSSLPVGNIWINAKFEGNYDINEIEECISINPKFTVPKAIVAGSDEYIIADVSGGAGGRVVVSNEYGDEEYVSADVEGSRAKIPLSGFETGTYDIRVTYQNEDGFGYENTYRLYVVDSLDFDLELENPFDTLLFKEEESVYAILPDWAEGKLSLYIDDKLVDSTDELDTPLIFDSSNLTIGQHTATVKFTGNKNLTNSFKFDVVCAYIDIPDEVIANYEDFETGPSRILVNTYGGANGVITISVDGKKFKTINGSDNYYPIYLDELSRGKHNVTVTYSDDKYGSISKSNMVDFDYVIGFSFENAYYMQDSFINIFMPDCIGNGDLTVTVDGKSFEWIKGDMISVNTSKLSYGDHDVVIKYSGDDKYPAKQFNNTMQITGNIICPDNDIVYQSDEKISLVLPSDAKGSLNIKIIQEDEDDYSSTTFVDKEIPLSNGKAEYSLSNLPLGNWLIDAEYTGSDYEVISYESYKEVVPVDFGSAMLVLGENKTVTFNSNNKESSVLNITLYKVINSISDGVDDKNYVVVESKEIPVVDGKASYTFTNLKLGAYNIDVTQSYKDKKGYGSGFFFDVVPKQVSYLEELLIGIKGDLAYGVKYPVFLDLPSDATGKAIVTIKNANYKDRYTDVVKTFEVNCPVKFDLPILDVGYYGLIVNYTGNYGDLLVDKVLHVIDNQFTPEITAKANDVFVGEDVVIDITSPKFSSGSITVTLGDKTYNADVANGKSSVTISDLTSGNYTATVKFTGDGNYKPAEETVQFKVLDKSSIVAKDKKLVYSANGKYSVTVYGTDGKIAEGVEVIFTISGKQVGKAITDNKGIASYVVKNAPGTYKVKATALGISKTNKVTVKHLVTLKSVTVKKSAKKLVLTATLGKINKKYLKNKKITFKFKGKKYTAKTNKKGVAKVTIKSSVLKKLKVGKKITYQATYSKDTVKKTVKVKK